MDHECKDQLVVERPPPTIRGGRGLLFSQVAVGGVGKRPNTVWRSIGITEQDSIMLALSLDTYH